MGTSDAPGMVPSGSTRSRIGVRLAGSALRAAVVYRQRLRGYFEWSKTVAVSTGALADPTPTARRARRLGYWERLAADSAGSEGGRQRANERERLERAAWRVVDGNEGFCLLQLRLAGGGYTATQTRSRAERLLAALLALPGYYYPSAPIRRPEPAAESATGTTPPPVPIYCSLYTPTASSWGVLGESVRRPSGFVMVDCAIMGSRYYFDACMAG